MKKIFALALACATVSVAMLGSSFAQTESSERPKGLIPADVIEAQLQSDNVTADDTTADDSALDEEGVAIDSLRPGGGYHGGRPGGGYHPRPAPRPVPVPRYPSYPSYPHYPRHPRPVPYPRYPRPVPYPVPYPAPIPGRLITCFAQSPANGLSYAGTAYSAYTAQDLALSACYNATGYECVAQGCRY